MCIGGLRQYILVGGGGGATRSGVPNALVLLLLFFQLTFCCHHLSPAVSFSPLTHNCVAQMLFTWDENRLEKTLCYATGSQAMFRISVHPTVRLVSSFSLSLFLCVYLCGVMPICTSLSGK